MNPYNYNSAAFKSDLRLKNDTSKLLHYEIQFQSAIDTGYSENSLVKGEYYQPKLDHKVPLAILVHGMGDHSVFPCKLLARSLLKKGIACFVPYLTIHSKRIPEPMRANFPFLSPDQWFECYRFSVIDIRQIVDWAHNRPELNTEKITLLGISFGGFVSAIAMGIDNRIKAGIFIVTGGNSNKISWLNKAGQYRKRYRRTEAEHLEIQKSYSRYLEDIAVNGFENVPSPHQSFLTDPLTFAGYLRGKNVLMINARWDKYIPVEVVTEFWQACGTPAIKWIPSGHASLWFWYPAIRKSIIDFIQASFEVTGHPG